MRFGSEVWAGSCCQQLPIVKGDDVDLVQDHSIVEGESFLFMHWEQSWVDRLSMKGRWEVANQSREQFNNTR